MILGVSPMAGDTEIKRAYKNLVKIYHPDAGVSKDTDRYTRVVEAYQFLCANPFVQQTTGTKVFGNTNSYFYKKSDSYADFEKKYQKQRAKSKVEFEEKLADYQKQMEREKEQYENAMDKINSIRLAEAIKVILQTSK